MQQARWNVGIQAYNEHDKIILYEADGKAVPVSLLASEWPLMDPLLATEYLK